MFRQQTYILFLTFTVISLLAACQAGGDFTGREYMPDMAHSQAYELYTPSRTVTMDGEKIELGKKGMSAMLPVAGTIPRGYVPYYYPDTNEGYEQAGKELRNPYNGKPFNTVLADGKISYDIYCAVCHGSNGKGKGSIVASGKYPTPRSYFDEDRLEMSEGKMFHSIHHGKNLMGSYASQLSKEDRWKVIAYIKDMQADEIAAKKGVSKAQALAMITGVNTYKDKAGAKATTTTAAPIENVDTTQAKIEAEKATAAESAQFEADIKAAKEATAKIKALTAELKESNSNTDATKLAQSERITKEANAVNVELNRIITKLEASNNKAEATDLAQLEVATKVAEKITAEIETYIKATGESAEKAEADKKAAAEKAEADKVAAEKAEADKKAAAEKAEADKKATEKTEADKKAAAEKAEADKKATEKTEADKKAATEKAEADKKAATEKAEADKKAATEKAEADKKAAAEKAEADKKAAEKAEADRKAAEKAEADKKAAAEKAEADKVAAAKLEADKKAEAAKTAAAKLEADKKAEADKAAKEKSALEDKKVLKKGEKIALKNVFFKTSSADLTATSYAELNKLVTLLKKNPNTKVEIGGHTDNKGKKNVNDWWSKARAKAVYDYVVSKGANKNQLTYKGYGPTNPVASNDTDAGRAKNRRVELKVLK